MPYDEEREPMVCRQLLRKLHKSESGATIVEFAVVAGVFFFMMLSIIEYGLMMMTKVAIESAAQTVSRASSVNSYPGCSSNRLCVVRAVLKKNTANLINPNYVQVTAS